MNVIFDGVYEDDGAVDGFSDGCEISVEVWADGIGEKGMSVFGRED